MITTDCRVCGSGPQDLPGDEICDDCRIEMRNEDPAAVWGDDDYEEGYL